MKKQVMKIAVGVLVGLSGAARAETRDLIRCQEDNTYNEGTTFLQVYGSEENGYYFAHYSCDTYTGERECLGFDPKPIQRIYSNGRPTKQFENDEVSVVPYYRTQVSLTYKKTNEFFTISGCET